MICPNCRYGVHGACKGGTWCDCQHRTEFHALLGIGTSVPFNPDMWSDIDRLLRDEPASDTPVDG